MIEAIVAVSAWGITQGGLHRARTKYRGLIDDAKSSDLSLAECWTQIEALDLAMPVTLRPASIANHESHCLVFDNGQVYLVIPDPVNAEIFAHEVGHLQQMSARVAAGKPLTDLPAWETWSTISGATYAEEKGAWATADRLGTTPAEAGLNVYRWHRAREMAVTTGVALSLGLSLIKLWKG